MYLIAAHQTSYAKRLAQALAGLQSMPRAVATDTGHVALSASGEHGKATARQLEKLASSYPRLQCGAQLALAAWLDSLF